MISPDAVAEAVLGCVLGEGTGQAIVVHLHHDARPPIDPRQR